MNYLLSFSALLLFALQVIAQPTIDWYKTFDDSYHYLDGSTCTVIDNEGNVYVSGEAYNNYSRSSEYDIVTIKYSPEGQKLWLKEYHNFNYDGAIKMIYDDNSIYILGLSQDSITYNENGVVLKYNVNGNLLWAYRLGNSNYFDFNPKDMILYPNIDYIYITGYASNYDSSRGVVSKLGKDGVLSWSKRIRYESYKYNLLSHLALEQGGDIIAGGYVSYGYPNPDAKRLLVKIENNGNIVGYRSDDYYYVTDMVCNLQNELFITSIKFLPENHSEISISKLTSSGGLVWFIARPGAYNYNNYYSGFPPAELIKIDSYQNLIVSSILETSFQRNSLCVYKVNTNGNIVWQYIDSTTISPTNIETDNDNNIYINSIYGYESFYDNFRLTKLNTSGNLVWKAGNILNWQYKYRPYGLSVRGNVIITSGYSDYDYLAHSDYLTVKYSQPIGIQPISSEIPDRFSLSQNYPNPFNPVTSIKFDVASVGQRHAFDVRLIVYDILGREVTTIVNEQLKPGKYEVEWNASDFPSGVYFYKVSAVETSRRDVFTDTKKMILMK